MTLFAVLGSTPAWAHESGVAAENHYESGGRCTTCTGSPFFHWDFPNLLHGGNYKYGSVYQGTSLTTFNSCMKVLVGGIPVLAASVAADGTRGFTTQEYASGSTRIIREIFVPDAGYDFARWVDSFRNSGAADANVTIQYQCYYLGCTGGATYYFDGGLGGGVEGAGDDCTVGSSDGDTSSEPTDTWFAWNDDDDTLKPAVAVVTHGDGADEEPTAVAFAGGFSSYFTIDYRLEIPAGETQLLLMFLVQAEDTDTALATADFLVGLPPEATEGLDDPLPTFMNHITDGRPAVSPGGPYSCSEGGEIVLEPRIFDREGDPTVWAWDLSIPQDGKFETDELNPIFSCAGLDGPTADDITVALHVEEDIDGGHIVDKTTDIEVLNVAPIITSVPPPGARRGGTYSYLPTVVDPGIASTTETFTFELVEDAFPEGMTIEPATGQITWIPRADQLGDHDVEMTMEDDDGAPFFQEWSINVTDNTAPYAPNPLYPSIDNCVRVLSPTFKVSNSSDLDEDPLTYYFEVDRDAGFRSIDLQQSEGVPQGVSGFTEWMPPRALINGETYYWRTWVTDSIEESEKITGVFEVCADPVDDGGTDADIDADSDIDGGGGEAGAGCACRTSGSGQAGFGLMLLALAAVLVRRKK